METHSSSYLVIPTHKAQQYSAILKMGYSECCPLPDQKDGVYELAVKIVEARIQKQESVLSPRDKGNVTSPPTSPPLNLK